MYLTLALRHLLVRPGRALVLLIGYAVGVAVMIVLLSIGDAMVAQSRDVSLIGGGQLTALPEGVDVEALRTGGLAGMFFGIDAARFVSRQLIGGPRHRDMVTAVSPVIEQKLLTAQVGDSSWPLRAGGEIPSATMAVGSNLNIVAGAWRDTRRDSQWIAPDDQALYDQIDHFHAPPADASSWAEWHYFNVAPSDREWWHLTLLVGGDSHTLRSGGEVLITRRSADGGHQRYVTDLPREDVSFDTLHAGLRLGANVVSQHDGVYHMHASAGAAVVDLTLLPSRNEYFPPLELGGGDNASGYVVPALTGLASGRLCVGGTCQTVRNAPAYHDHNWGSWKSVTWEWGAGHGASHALLYGGIIPAQSGSEIPFFLALEDSLGVEQIYRFDAVESMGSRAVAGFPGIAAPDSFRIVASRLGDTLTVVVRVADVMASRSRAAGPDRAFLQMRGDWRAAGTAAGAVVRDSGQGFFESWVPVGTIDRRPQRAKAVPR